MMVLNPDYVKYKNQPLDISLRNQVGISIKPDEVDKVCNIVHNLISEKKSYVEKIEQVRSKYIYNIGESGRFGAEYILSKLIRKK